MKITEHPNIVKAANEIALDNGCVNRFEEFNANKFDVTLDGEILDRVEKILGILNDEALDIVCCGDESEARAICGLFGVTGMAVSQTLNEIFEQV
nr:hypothetical protein [Pseudodesulfovibrio sp.]